MRVLTGADRIGWWGGGFFVMLGLALLAMAVWLLRQDQRFMARAVHVEGVVTTLLEQRSETGTRYAPEIAFRTAEGRRVRFVDDVGTGHPAWRAGDRVGIWYDPAQPAHARLGGFLDRWQGLLIVVALALVSMLTGVCTLGGLVLTRRRAAWLRAHGRRVRAQVVAVLADRRMQVDGKSPWRITCAWRDPLLGREHHFVSVPLWFDPRPYLGNGWIDVLIDAEHPHRYLVDTRALCDVA